MKGTDNDDYDDDSDSRTHESFSLSPTGYGVWKSMKVKERLKFLFYYISK